MLRYQKSSLLVSLVLSALAVVWTGCGGSSDSLPANSISIGDSAKTDGSKDRSTTAPAVTEPTQILADGPSTETPARVVEESGPPEVVIETNLGNIRIRLKPEESPLTVSNFLMNYVDRGFYDGTIFHFVEKDFIVATGGFDAELNAKDPRADIVNEAHNGLKNLRGTVAMSRDPRHINSANCQFFINLVDNPSLDHQGPDDDSTYGYCVFGEVIEGMKVVDQIAGVAVEDKENFPSTPKDPISIHSIRRQ